MTSTLARSLNPTNSLHQPSAPSANQGASADSVPFAAGTWEAPWFLDQLSAPSRAFASSPKAARAALFGSLLSQALEPKRRRTRARELRAEREGKRTLTRIHVTGMRGDAQKGELN